MIRGTIGQSIFILLLSLLCPPLFVINLILFIIQVVPKIVEWKENRDIEKEIRAKREKELEEGLKALYSLAILKEIEKELESNSNKKKNKIIVDDIEEINLEYDRENSEVTDDIY